MGRSEPRLPGGSGTTVLDVDLTKLSGLTWGVWTVEVSESGAAPTGLLGDQEATVAATFAQPQAPEATASILPAPPSG